MSDQHRSRQELGVELVALRKQVADLRAAAQIRRRVENALRESESLFRRGFEEAPVGLGIFGESDRLLLANPALLRRLGYSTMEELRALVELKGLFPGFESTRVFAADAGATECSLIQVPCRRADGCVEVISCRVGRNTGAAFVGTLAFDSEAEVAGNSP